MSEENKGEPCGAYADRALMFGYLKGDAIL